MNLFFTGVFLGPQNDAKNLRSQISRILRFKADFKIWATKKTRPYVPWNTGRLIGIQKIGLL